MYCNQKVLSVLIFTFVPNGTVARVLPPRFARRQIVGRILNMNFVHMRPPLAIHGSTATCLNIVFKHSCTLIEH